jgi:hypothetical protein
LDQFFDESQFESYRRLGFHVATSTFGAARELVEKEANDGLTGLSKENLQKEDLFTLLQTRWYPPSSAVSTSFTKHAEQFNVFQERLRTDPRLRFLPEFLSKAAAMVDTPARKSDLRLPRRPADLRNGFFFCVQLVQLMETVYLDLNPEKYFDHPDSRGWVNLFRR